MQCLIVYNDKEDRIYAYKSILRHTITQHIIWMNLNLGFGNRSYLVLHIVQHKNCLLIEIVNEKWN